MVQFRIIKKMHGCDDNDIMVFKLVEALRGNVPDTIIVCQLKSAVSFLSYALCLKDVWATGVSGDIEEEQPENHYSNGS